MKFYNLTDNLALNEVSELSFNEVESITGGESGWYYLGKVARFIDDHTTVIGTIIIIH